MVDTQGDRRLDVPIWELGGKGVFAKEVQAAVLDGRADLAVHTAKDLPSVAVPGLVLAAVPERGDPRDALVGSPLAALPEGAEVATGSLRRQAELRRHRPDLRFASLRGNMQTRLAKAADHDAIVVAATALDRLGLADHIAERLAVDDDAAAGRPGRARGRVPRGRRRRCWRASRAIEHEPTRRCVDAERAFLAELGGDCSLPAGAHAVAVGTGLRLRGASWPPSTVRRCSATAQDGPDRTVGTRWPATCSTAAAPTCSAADPYARRMIIVTGSVQARPEHLDEVLALSLEHVHRSRAEPGCLLHSVHQDVEDANRVVFVEHWADLDALAHPLRRPRLRRLRRGAHPAGRRRRRPSRSTRPRPPGSEPRGPSTVLVVELTPETATGYVRLAFDQMLAVAERLGDERVNERPLGPTTNAVAALIVHCCGVSEFWLGHVGTRTRQPPRARGGVLAHGQPSAELRAMVAATLPPGRGRPPAPSRPVRTSPHSGGRAFLDVDDDRTRRSSST